MLESNVRSYSRVFIEQFNYAKDEYISTVNGTKYLDFFAGAGALNYGHNNETLKSALVKYVENDGISHALDMDTSARSDFLNAFSELILKPKGLDYLVQFTSPSGTNANEAAIKLAKKVTGRPTIFSFTGGFHGMTMGSLAATGNEFFRQGLAHGLNDVVFMPYEKGFLNNFDSLAYIDFLISDPSSGVDKPAAMILETVQAEGGINVASDTWLRGIREICDKHEILLICDDIQVGCGRTGEFFSFEKSGIKPDLVTLSKSISGYGLPMAIVLIKPEYDQWQPGQHSGTFRGNQHAFVTAAEALRYRKKIKLGESVRRKAEVIESTLINAFVDYEKIEVRGRGMIWGVDFGAIDNSLAKSIAKECFADGLIIECAGRYDEVLKLLPPLTISDVSLLKGLEKIIKISKALIGDRSGS